MQILRVQHKIDGAGIFRSHTIRGNVRLFRMCGWKKLSERHRLYFPLPKYDTGIDRRPFDDEFCAFKSIQQFQEWVKEDEIKNLIKIGFKVLLLDVSECVVGEYQVLYKKTDIISFKDISELFQ